jgi:hypothetical protein
MVVTVLMNGRGSNLKHLFSPHVLMSYLAIPDTYRLLISIPA